METEEQTSYESGESPAKLQKRWEAEIKAFLKRARFFRKNGNTVSSRYRDEETKEVDGINTFRINLFYKNISTVQAMLYGNKPKIDVKREFDDPDDDVARVAAVITERLLSRDISSPGNSLCSVLQQCLQDRLLPGLGVARLRYDAEFYEDQGMEQVSDEVVEEIYVHWQDFAWGWARVWSEVPWVAFRSWLTKDEMKSRFGEKVASNVEYQNQKIAEKDTESTEVEPDAEDNIQKAEVWEIWCKENKKVYWYSPDAPLILDSKDDPLGLDGFFPMPTPMMANLTTRQVMPKADFMFAQDLYNEIDVLQTRISMITRAVKVVGVYDKSSEGVQRMLTEGFENDLIPVDNWAMFAEKGGLKGQIDWFPTEDISRVLSNLRNELNSSMELLYEVTGLSDILRGANTNPYTSDGTNQLKAKFGSISVQSLQEDFARFASEMESVKAEIIGKHFSPVSIINGSLAHYLPKADHPLVPGAVELLKSRQFKWRVNIKPESIAMMDYAQLKSERTEYLTSVATFIQSATSMVQQVPQALPILLEMLKWGMAGFKGSDYLEGTLDQAIEAAANMPPPGQDQGAQQAEQLKRENDQLRHQQEMQKIQAKSQADTQLMQLKFDNEMQKLREEAAANLQEISAKSQADIRKIMEDLRADLATIARSQQADEAVEASQAVNAAAEQQVEHENTLTEMELEHRYATLEAGQRNRESSTD